VSTLRLGLPSCEEDILETLESATVFPAATMARIKSLRAFRNILVHRYGRVNDHLVFRVLTDQLADFDTFIEEPLGLVHRAES